MTTTLWVAEEVIGIEQRRPDLSLIIPCYNEAATLERTVGQIRQYLSAQSGVAVPAGMLVEILLINDGSTDNTLTVMKNLSDQDARIRVVSYPVNRGRGEAIKLGIRKSLGDRIILLDADLSYDVDHIGEILATFAADTATDVVVVSPYMKGGVVAGVPFSRLFVSRCANWLMGGFFEGKFATVTCVVRGYRGDLIRQLYLVDSGKELHLEILRKLGLYNARIQEIPGRLIWKKHDAAPRRKTNLKTVYSAQKHFLYALMIRPTRYFKYLTVILFAIGLYEVAAILLQAASAFDPSLSLNHALRMALKHAYAYSPYSFFIGIGALIMGFQTFSVLVILQTLKNQQEETLRHMLALLEDRNAVQTV
ncbi:MAG: glycosyltransferase family 2 protein [Candidatus Melainabacteria bacterium]